MQKVIDDEAQFTYMNVPASIEAVLDGFSIMTNLSEHYPEFPASSIGGRRPWVEANRDKVLAYLKGYIRASEWLLEPANRNEAIDIAEAVGHERETLPVSYDNFTHNGMVKYGTLSRTGLQQVGELLIERNVIQNYHGMGKYADPSYQQQALQ